MSLAYQPASLVAKAMEGAPMKGPAMSQTAVASDAAEATANAHADEGGVDRGRGPSRQEDEEDEAPMI